ncbi:type VII secretion integral membrane protein EccD [Micromonospora sp. NPDC050200]|uniref:type VII secretion integral membrane protein EccD n=1 Tax=Micromonospora sp. NPDC050200 TaxID=3155664 RepID=UPI0033F3955E
MTVSPAAPSRLVISGPDRRIELAVPSDVVVADLLPALLDHLGSNLADSGLAHGGWVLQRVGGPPLDADVTVASLDLHDGETLFLRPLADQLPPVHFDDLIDGVATSVTKRSGYWRPAFTRYAMATVGAVAVAVTLVAVATAGPALLRAVGAAGIAVLLFGIAIGARVFDEHIFGLLCAVSAIAALAVAGVIAPDASSGQADVGLGAPHVLTGGTAMLAGAVVAAYVYPSARPLFAAVASLGCFVVLGGALGTLADLSVTQAVAVTVVAATLFTVAVPLLAARMTGIRLAPLPTKWEHLQEDIDPEPSERVLADGLAADRLMTALHSGAGIVSGIGLVLLALAGTWATTLLVLLAGIARLLMSRTMTSAWHRAALGVPALLGLAVLAIDGLGQLEPVLRVSIVLVALPVSIVQLLVAGRALSKRRLSPYWGRAGDVLETLSTVALVPVALAVLDVYAMVRGIGG